MAHCAYVASIVVLCLKFGILKDGRRLGLGLGEVTSAQVGVTGIGNRYLSGMDGCMRCERTLL